MNTQRTRRFVTDLSLIRVGSSQYDSVEAATDALAGVSSLPGYVFGYIDAKERRTVTFHADTAPNSPVPTNKGMTRVSARVAFHI